MKKVCRAGDDTCFVEPCSNCKPTISKGVFYFVSRPEKVESTKTPRTKTKKVSVAAKRSHNKPCAPALWRELNRSCPMKVPLKTDWVPVTEKRLNSAMKRLNFAQG